MLPFRYVKTNLPAQVTQKITRTKTAGLHPTCLLSWLVWSGSVLQQQARTIHRKASNPQSDLLNKAQ